MTQASTIDDWFDPNEDKIREECGVFGIFGMDNATSLVALGLHALQHRGQEACGIASYDGEKFHTERHLGLVGDNFTGADPAKRLPGHLAIGHNRYSTAGQTILRNVQPLFSELHTGGFAVAHNGHLTNAYTCLLYTSPSPRDATLSRMPSSA